MTLPYYALFLDKMGLEKEKKKSIIGIDLMDITFPLFGGLMTEIGHQYNSPASQ